MKESKQVLLHLTLINGVGPALTHTILRVFNEQALSKLYTLHSNDLMRMLGCTPKQAHTIVSGLADTTLVEREVALLEQHDISWISMNDSEYPSILREIYLPPIGLYVQGSVAALHKPSLAIIGSRQADLYGKRAVERFVPRLVEQGYSIVSGGALGLDAMAHQAALTHKGTTVAILGSGLLRPNPLRNRTLFNAIVQSGGALVSSFPLQMEAMAGNFPARNRIISGISKGSFVVQAAAKSGARITAQFALDQGRHVFTLPGQWDHPLSQGCHELIIQGATLALSPESILLEMEGGIIQQQELFAQQETSTDSINPGVITLGQRIVQLCRQPIGIDDIAQQLESTVVEIQSELFILQMEGKVAQNFAGLWQSSY